MCLMTCINGWPYEVNNIEKPHRLMSVVRVGSCVCWCEVASAHRLTFVVRVGLCRCWCEVVTTNQLTFIVRVGPYM
jgi:hypothetical protein